MGETVGKGKHKERKQKEKVRQLWSGNENW